MSLIERVGGINAARKIVEGAPDETAQFAIDYADNGVIDYLKNENGWQCHYSGGWNSVHSIISAHFNDNCLIKLSDLRAAIAEQETKLISLECLLSMAKNEAMDQALTDRLAFESLMRVAEEKPTEAANEKEIATINDTLDNAVENDRPLTADEVAIEIPFFVWQEVGSSKPVEDELYLVADEGWHTSAFWINEYYFELADKTYPSGFYEPNGVNPLQNVTHFMRIKKPEVQGNE